MYDIRQFQPTLYLVLLLGLVGFALASGSPFLLLVSVPFLIGQWWLVRTKRFKPLPRWSAALITLVGMFFALAVFGQHREALRSPLLVGQFLLFMHIVKLFDLRGNRDYAQLLVLSLLLMVAAAISTASLLFGVILVVYLFVSLYCCLLFHLRVEAQNARTALGLSEEKADPITLKQDQRFLPRSMRRLAVFVSVTSVILAVVVFVFFPRGSGGGLFGGQTPRGASITGFSDTLSFNQLARITQSEEKVGYVQVWRDEVPVRDEMLYLRGVTLDSYTGKTPGDDQIAPLQWRRSGGEEEMYVIEESRAQRVDSAAARSLPMPRGSMRQRFQINSTGTNAVFGIAGMSSFRPINKSVRLRVIGRDQTMMVHETINTRFEYEVISTGTVVAPYRAGVRSNIDPAVRAYLLNATAPQDADPARRGVGPELAAMARRKLARPGDTSADMAIAQAIESHLQSNFAYTLDLTDTGGPGDRDPIVAFLTDWRRGHCEYFAGAMTLMLQDLGIPARVVNGFKTDQYNQWGYYEIRQSHAHSWVEAYAGDGQWRRFDPTSGRQARGGRESSAWGSLLEFFDFMEYKWASSVIAYDTESRSTIIQKVEVGIGQSAQAGAGILQTLRSWLEDEQFWTLTTRVVAVVVAGLVFVLFIVAMKHTFSSWQLRQRAQRIGLNALPHRLQLRLARQLAFYDDLTLALERHGVHKPEHMTPLEFARSLVHLPAETYESVVRLTGIFYRIRFGEAEIDPGRARRLRNVVDTVTRKL